ncbi:MAG TPA: hypothetical protein VF020_05905 [Chthoniobacterales bacterium]
MEPVHAEQPWSYDSAVQGQPQTPTSDSTDEQQIVALLNRMTDRWNSHDLEGYMDVLWQSPALCYVCEGQEIMGWGNLLAEYQRGFVDRNTMGSVHVDRTLVRIISPGMASALDWWSVSFPSPKSHTDFATTTYILQKFPEQGWKIVLLHTSFVEP